jgi:HAD superfamily hydrolase (TIGR01484 family)
MKLRALACDYDGTLASQDRIGPDALAALERARMAGLRLVLVTGRTFFDLTRVCGHLQLFDAVVVENGAVLYWPGSQTLRDQAPAPSPRLLAELDRRGVHYQVGRVVVDTARSNGERAGGAGGHRRHAGSPL